MALLKEFKEFALKGNVVELAIAVIIGAAFGTIVSSLVDDIITPLILTPMLKAANLEDIEQLAWGAVKWGKFVSAVIKFILIAFALFWVVKAVNSLNRKREQPAAPVAPEYSLQEKLLMEIRDSLKR